MNLENPKHAPWLVLMMKAPRPGTVKTRLAVDLGPERATAVYRRMVERIVASVFPPDECPWRPVVAYAPRDAEDEIRAWLAPLCPSDTLFLPQPEGGLGGRLTALFSRGFDAGAPAVLAVGADCIEIDAGEMRACFAALRDAPLLMGEARDGGYWTIGMSGRHFEIFENMPWSEPNLARATRERARELGLELSERGMKTDIDALAELQELSEAMRRDIDANAEI